MPTEFWCVGGKEAGDLEFETSLPQAKRERENRKEGKGVGGRVVGKAKRMGLSI